MGWLSGGLTGTRAGSEPGSKLVGEILGRPSCCRPGPWPPRYPCRSCHTSDRILTDNWKSVNQGGSENRLGNLPENVPRNPRFGRKVSRRKSVTQPFVITASRDLERRSNRSRRWFSPWNVSAVA